MDLYENLPAASGDGGATGSSSSATGPNAAAGFASSATMLKPRATLASSHLMPPPKRPAARPAGAAAKPALVVPAQPIDVHGQSSSSTDGGGSGGGRPRSGSQGQGQQEWDALEGPDAYDPAKPNDYMEYCEQRLERKKQEERRKELEKYMQEKEAEEARRREQQRQALGAGGSEALPPSQSTPQGPAAAAMGRGRGRGVSNLPAWMLKQQEGGAAGGPVPGGLAGDGGGGGGGSAATPMAVEEGRFEDAGAPGGKARGRGGGIGNMLMKKMGYKDGEGLGREGAGITKAIQYKATGGGQGIVRGPQLSSSSSSSQPPTARGGSGGAGSSAEAGAAPQQQKRRKRGLFSNPTKVVLLKNMVGPGEVDDELEGETKEECEKHGPVRECLIFELGADSGYPPEERVRIFVAFEKQESAVKAYVAMNGRFFGGRQVQAAFFDEERFARRDLAPREGE